MACSKSMLPSEEKAFFLKYISLMHDGGKLVLIKQCNKRSSPDLVTELHKNKSKLKILTKPRKGKKVISQEEFDLMYPVSGDPPDTSKFDVTLLSCLLRTLFGVKDLFKNPPLDADMSVGADVYRLRKMRNYCSHPIKTEMTKLEFNNKWQELEQVLLRFGNHHNHPPGIPDLQTTIDDLKQSCIDPGREKELQDQIAVWKAEHDNLKDEITEVKTDMSGLKKTVQNQTDELGKLNKRQTASENHSKTMDDQVRVLQEDLLAAQKTAKRAMEMSPQLKSLASRMELDDVLNDQTYVKTEQYEKAKSILQQHRVLFISGHPGEGKTTMARKLACEISPPDRCIELEEPSDWRLINFGTNQFDTLLIDDIFGAGALDKSLARQWERHISRMPKVSKNKEINIIITTRHYILEGAQAIMRKMPIFEEKYVITLSSKSLLESEMQQILENKLKENEREYNRRTLLECVRETKSYFGGLPVFGLISESNDFVFGYPQCVKMFVENDDLFKRGSSYFSKPKEFFKACVEDLYKGDNEKREKFLALILIWAKSGMTLKESELHPESEWHTPSDELKSIAKEFGHDLNPGLICKVRKFLKDLQGGFLDHNTTLGSYQFNHHVIEDMIGIVLSKDYPEAVLRFATRDFILRYVTTDSSKDDDFDFFVEAHLYKDLAFRMLKLFLKPEHLYRRDRTTGFQSGGRCPNKIYSHSDIDAGLIASDAFKNARFLESFVKYLRNDDSENKWKSSPVITMNGHFLKYGIQSEHISIFLPEYFLQNDNSLLIGEMLKQRVPWGDGGPVLDVALLIAVHNDNQDIVESLIQHGAKVSEEAKYIAAVSKHSDIIPLLMGQQSNSLDKFKIINGNNALIASSKRGLLKSVKTLIRCGADIHYRNEKGLGALDKAVLFKRVDTCRVLLEAGVEVDNKVKPFKRTPLHTACDKGFVEVVDVLLQYGPNTDIQDHRGHYAIHCAAIQGHIEVVQKLLQHDVSLSKQRIISYGSHSKIKGMTVFHIAIWKGNLEMLKMLLQAGADPSIRDCYGRTPLYYAAQSGKASHVEVLIPVMSPSDVNKQGCTPLHAAITWKHWEVVRLLLPVTADVNIADKKGETPLHIACRHGNVETVRMLVNDYHADVRMQTKKGLSVFDITKEGHMLEFLAQINKPTQI